ncbi:MAG: pyridoxamine 5'-phosphate oxidase family protein [Campylobacteraceae bacterium]|jgi:uncharacterized pyridoxamine 5'-phosphate oxidase family protein|nr:pyridoxamine 5'-phosphate oxidase family protein [Campylobacteraceae bacterium]
MSNIQEVIDFLNKAGVFYIGTVDNEDRPHVRPFGFVMEWEGKLTFITNNQKEVYKQLSTNPYADICVFGADNIWIRISGRVKLFQSVEANKKAFEIMPSLKDLYGDENNPVLAHFSYEEGAAAFWSFESIKKPFKIISLNIV